MYTELSQQVTEKVKSQKIALKSGNDVEVVNFKNIFFGEAQGSYTKIVFCKDNNVREILCSYSLAEYEELFPGDVFFRIHKTYLINCGHIKRIIKEEASQVQVGDGYKLPISRRRFSPLLEFMKQHDYHYE